MSSGLPYFVPTRFVWRFGGTQLCGSFTRWVETVPMEPVDQSPGMFLALVHLPPGYHQYKFIVDGDWRHDETMPFMPDPLGNVNNWLYVRQPDAAGAVPIGLHMPANVGRQPGQAPYGDAHLRASTHGANGGQESASATSESAFGASSRGHGDAVSEGAQGAYINPAVSRSGAVANTGAIGGPGEPPAQQSQHSVSHAGLNGNAAGTSGQLAEFGIPENSAVLAPIALQEDEPSCTRKKVHEFLHSHTAYELIPESGKVVLIDYDYSIRRAFHALAEQGIASAPLWDRSTQSVAGMISASDFIETLKQLREASAGQGGGLSDSEIDAHSIRALRQASSAAVRSTSFPTQLDLLEFSLKITIGGAMHLENRCECMPATRNVSVAGPVFLGWFRQVVRTLIDNRCSMAPILSSDPPPGSHPLPNNAACGRTGDPPAVLHVTSLSGVLASLMRHFRASLASLPLLAQPLASMPLGSWSPDSPIGRQGQALSPGGMRVATTVTPIHTVHPDMPLTTALSMLMEAGVSALPVVDQDGVLLDVYARSDITLLTRGSAYLHLAVEDMSVRQALALASGPPPPRHDADGQMSGDPSQQQPQIPPAKRTRLYVCTRQDQLRVVLERLSMPAVRRVIVVHPETSKVEGIISLSDVARFLFL